MKRFLLVYLLPPVLALILKILYFLARKKIPGLKDFKKACESGPVIIAVFHGDLIPITAFFSRHIVKMRNVKVLVSPSNDGIMLGKTIKALGGFYETGDNRKKGAAGLIKMIKTIRNEKGIPVFAVDGPLGPAYEVKPGVVKCAHKTKTPVIAVCASAKKAIRINKSWDKIFFPVPFTRLVILFSEPVYISNDILSENDKLSRIMKELKQKCNGKAGVK
jgi:hypothetical protein